MRTHNSGATCEPIIWCLVFGVYKLTRIFNVGRK